MTTEANGSLDYLVECLSENLNEYCLADTRCWVAFSGGLDSTVLLQVAWRYFRELNLTDNLGVIHINHGLQDASEQWLNFCETQAQSLGIACRSFHLQLDAKSANLEEAAREGRYRAFERVLDNNAVLLMAHHLNDQAETVLYRLMRGSGTQGLAGIPKKRALGQGTLIRPFLSVDRDQLEQVAKSCHFRWIEDPSNTDVNFDRNFIRHQVLPLLQTRWPSASRQVAKSADFCRGDRNQVQILARQDWRTLNLRLERAGFSIAIEPLIEFDQNRLYACLRFGLNDLQVCIPNDAQFSEILRQIIHTGARVDSKAVVTWGDNSGVEPKRFSAGRFRDRMHVFIDSPMLSSDTDNLPLSLKCVIPNACCISRADPTSTVNAPCVDVSLPWNPAWSLEIISGGPISVLSSDLNTVWTIKPRCGGERSHPSNRRHSQKLKKLLQEADVPPWLRDSLPLIYQDETLVAVSDLWVETPFLTTDDETGVCVRLKNNHPWQVWLENRVGCD